MCDIDLGSGEGEEDDIDEEGREGPRTYCILRDKLFTDSHRTWTRGINWQGVELASSLL